MKLFLGFLLIIAALAPDLAFAGATSSPPSWVYPGAPNVSMLVTLNLKNITVLTAGTPADIGTIPIPIGVNRYGISSLSIFVAESLAGTLASATFQIWSGPGGTGTLLLSSAGPAAATNFMVFTGASTVIQTSGTLFIRQTANSANAGVLSFYPSIFPLN